MVDIWFILKRFYILEAILFSQRISCFKQPNPDAHIIGDQD